MDYNKTVALAAPMVLFSMEWGSSPSPELSINSLTCNTGGLSGHTPVGCAETVFPPGNWSYSFLVNYTESVMIDPDTQFIILVTIGCMLPLLRS